VRGLGHGGDYASGRSRMQSAMAVAQILIANDLQLH
jgi:hypothetical protein